MERWVIRKAVARSPAGIVTAQHHLAAEAGAGVLARGGNAVDAAVTAGFLLQTVEPWMSGLAACGYLLVAEPDGEVTAVEFTGRTPGALDPRRYPADPGGALTFLGMPAAADGRNVRGYGAAVVPGAVRGLALALERFGTIGWDTALQPAVDQARRGLPVDWHAALAIALAEGDLRRDPAAASLFLPGGSVPEPDRLLPTAQLAATLEELAQDGPESFYRGRIAERLLGDLAAGGSTLSADDLAGYEAALYPAECSRIGGRTLAVAGASSGGRRLAEALAHFDAMHGPGLPGPRFYTAMTEALRAAFAAHRDRLVEEGGVSGAGGSTTHVSAVDAEGRMAALTFTLLNRFGARTVSPSTGILLNNGIAWFDLRPGKANSLRPRAVGLNNMCPTVLVDDRGPLAALGASGGNQIVPALAQVVAFLLHAGMDLDGALYAPRLQAGPGERITADLDLAPEIIAALQALGPVDLAQRGVYPRPFASPSGVRRADDGFEGLGDTTYPTSAAVAA